MDRDFSFSDDEAKPAELPQAVTVGYHFDPSKFKPVLFRWIDKILTEMTIPELMIHLLERQHPDYDSDKRTLIIAQRMPPPPTEAVYLGKLDDLVSSGPISPAACPACRGLGTRVKVAKKKRVLTGALMRCNRCMGSGLRGTYPAKETHLHELVDVMHDFFKFECLICGWRFVRDDNMKSPVKSRADINAEEDKRNAAYIARRMQAQDDYLNYPNRS